LSEFQHFTGHEEGAMVRSPKRNRGIVRSFAIFVVGTTLVLGCGRSPKPHPTCDAAEVPPDQTTSAPRPDIAQASFDFHGNNPEQREFVFLHDDGSYDYVERWDMGVPVDEDLQFPMGWDWKVDCRMHRCSLPDGTVCCHQRCRDGGASDVGYEAPDQFDCMNKADGGPYDWFLEGLRQGGMSELSECLENSDE
jgi:hypothetical protein